MSRPATPLGLTCKITNNTASLSSRSTASYLAAKSMRLKPQAPLEISERRQVGDAEELLANEDTKGLWWRNVTMDEGM